MKRVMLHPTSLANRSYKNPYGHLCTSYQGVVLDTLISNVDAFCHACGLTKVGSTYLFIICSFVKHVVSILAPVMKLSLLG